LRNASLSVHAPNDASSSQTVCEAYRRAPVSSTGPRSK
jgi:hypothetical protein